MKKFLAFILVLAVLAGSASAFADSTVDTIINAGTVQAFTDEAVSRGDLEKILTAGLSAESAINQQPWFFAAVTDPAVMQEIAGSGMSFGGSFPGGGFPGGDFPGGMPEGGPGGILGGAKAFLGDSPAAVIIFRDDSTSSPDPDFDCGLAAQNMYIAAVSLGYGAKIVSSPTMSLNRERHEDLCAMLGVDPSITAVAVLLIGHADGQADAASGASTRMSLSEKVSFVG